MLLGTALGLWLLPAPRTLGGITFDVHTLVYAAAFVLLGFQAIAFACFTKIFAISEGLLPPDAALDKLFRYITLELGVAVGAALTIAGFSASAYAVSGWGAPALRHDGLFPDDENCNSGRVTANARGADHLRQFLHERFGTETEMSCQHPATLPPANDPTEYYLVGSLFNFG